MPRRSFLRLAAPLMAMLCAALPANAQQTLGFGRLFTNDAIGDNRDRWRSAAINLSLLRGPSWSGALPTRPGEIIEYRFRTEWNTPADLRNPGPPSRPYAGVISLGAHTHFDWRSLEVAAGVDLFVLGEQTGLSDFQASLHDALSFPRVEIDGYEIDNSVQLGATLEVARSFQVNDVSVRPFAELVAGPETLARVGADLSFAGFGSGALLVRDPVSGQRYRGIAGDGPAGLSVSLGADAAYVANSQYLPSSFGIEAEDTRYRVRAGLLYEGGVGSVFYGATYLSEEFVGQPEGQIVGGLTIRLNF